MLKFESFGNLFSKPLLCIIIIDRNNVTNNVKVNNLRKSLSLTTTNSGADNIDAATFAAFEENFIGPSGLSFSINTSGNLIMTV